MNVAVGGNFDGGRVEASEICIDAECSNFEANPDKKRLLIDWIEYEKLRLAIFLRVMKQFQDV